MLNDSPTLVWCVNCQSKLKKMAHLQQLKHCIRNIHHLFHTQTAFSGQCSHFILFFCKDCFPACLFVSHPNIQECYRESARVGVKKDERWRASSAWRTGETHLLPEKRYCTPPRAFCGTKANSCKQNTSPTLFSKGPPLYDSLILPPLLHHFTHIRQWKRANGEHKKAEREKRNGAFCSKEKGQEEK